MSEAMGWITLGDIVTHWSPRNEEGEDISPELNSELCAFICHAEDQSGNCFISLFLDKMLEELKKQKKNGTWDSDDH